MNNLSLSHYNLETTLLGGQAFNFDFDGEYFWGFTQDKVIKLKTVETLRATSLHWQTFPENDDEDFVRRYLRLDVNYPNILKKIQKDNHIQSAIKKYPNLRLLKQDFEQTLLSFLISPNNNIKSIRKIIRAMNKKFGKEINFNGKKVFLFPDTERIADAKLEDLLECKLGFRAKFLKGAAKHLLKTNLSNKILKMNENDVRAALKEIKGVGDKITDCVLVFGLGFDSVTPFDIWAKRALVKFYKLNPKMKYEDMRKWVDNYFEGYAGWAGQFLFEYIRNMDA